MSATKKKEEERDTTTATTTTKIDHGIAEIRMDMGAMEEIIMNATDAENLVTNHLNVLTK